MKLQVNFGLECGHIVKTPDIEYFWNTNDKATNDRDASRYDSFISFNRPGNRLYCKDCDDMPRIKRISIYVMEFDTGLLS